MHHLRFKQKRNIFLLLLKRSKCHLNIRNQYLFLSGAEEGEVVVVASQLRGYGLWDGSVARDGSLLADCEGLAPSLLFLWVTDAQANLLQMELRAIQTSATASGTTLNTLFTLL